MHFHARCLKKFLYPTQREEVNVKKDQVAGVIIAGQHAGLHGGAVGQSLVGVDAAAGLLQKKVE